jgi:hypothetical protein
MTKEPTKVIWNLTYKDSTPNLKVINSAFEDWFQQQPFATQVGVKQMCRDSYAAGMGDPLVTYGFAEKHESVAAPPAKPLTDYEIWKNDGIMAANSAYGTTFETLRELVHVIEAAHGITKSK